MNRHDRRVSQKMNRHVQTGLMEGTTIVYGPQGCGKTRNAARIAKAYGLTNIVDDWYGLETGQKFQPKTLYLTNSPTLMERFPGVFRATTYEVAMEMVKIDEESA